MVDLERFLFLFIGIFIGLFGGITISNFVNPFQQRSGQFSFSTLESIFEQYIDELSEKQEEFRDELLKWKMEFEEMRKTLVKSENESTEFSKSELVIDLLNEGYNLEQVAKKLGIGKGEVELIGQLKNSEHTD